MQEKQQAIFITDLGFGDAGKGTITDFLARHYAAHTIVRYNRGPQAAHNVICNDGRHHTFSQFASGIYRGAPDSFYLRKIAENWRIYLSRIG